jgi:universal stress protein A
MCTAAEQMTFTVGTSAAGDVSMPWKKILFPIDFSDGSRAALATAVNVAMEANAELVIVNVFAPPIYFVVEPISMPAGYVADIVTAAEEGLAAWKLEALRQGITKVSTELLRGDATQQIVVYAKENGFDLIVIGTHGRSGIKHMLLGSVTEKVVRHAPCPVLVVRSP